MTCIYTHSLFRLNSGTNANARDVQLTRIAGAWGDARSTVLVQ